MIVVRGSVAATVLGVVRVVVVEEEECVVVRNAVVEVVGVHQQLW